MLFAASKMVSEHLDEGSTRNTTRSGATGKGVAYSEAVKVISINILYFDLGQGSDYIYHGQTRFTVLHQHNELALSHQQKYLFGRQSPRIYPIIKSF